MLCSVVYIGAPPVHGFAQKVWTSMHFGSWLRTLLVAPLLALAVLLVSCSANATNAAQHAQQTQTDPGTLTYVALGASDAFGIGTDYPAAESWPSVLAASLGPRVHLINLGVPGETAAQAQTGELPVALDSHPTIITVWLAVNDFANGVALAAYRTHLTALLTTLASQTHAPIFVGNLPDLTTLPYFANKDPLVLGAQVHTWNSAIAQVSAATGTHLVDLWSDGQAIRQHPEYISQDGLHPSELGARVLAKVFVDAMRQSGVLATLPAHG